MHTVITANMKATLDERDGTDLPEILDYLTTSALDTLKTPSDAVIRAGTFALGNLGHVVPYEHFEAAFIAAITEAAKP